MAPASTSKGRGRASAQAQVTSEASDPGQTNDNGQIRLTQSPSPTPSLDPFASLDPELHQQTLNSVGINGTSKADEMSEKEQSRLSDFAQHVLGGSASSIPQHDDAASLLAFSAGDEGLFEGAAQAHQGFTELLDAADRGRRLGDVGEDDIGSPRHEHMTEVMGGDEHQGEDEGEYQLEGQVDTRGEEGHVDPEPPMPGRGPPVSRTFGRKRRREEDRVQVTNNGEDGEPVDPVKMKKDSHKEVERRRRENINDGINEIARLVPGGLEKMGKGSFLKRAAEHFAEIANKARLHDEEDEKRDLKEAEFHATLAHVESRLAEEQARSIRFETSWREAEDRAASSQFELERIKAELEELKSKYEG